MAKGKKKKKKEGKKPLADILPPELMSQTQLVGHLTSLVQELEREKAIKEESQIETSHFHRSVAFLKPQVEEARAQLEHKKCFLRQMGQRLYSSMQGEMTKSRYLMASRLEASNVVYIENFNEIYLAESAILPSQRMQLQIYQFKSTMDTLIEIYKRTLKTETLRFDSFKNSMDYNFINFIDFFNVLHEKRIQMYLEDLSLAKKTEIKMIKSQQREYEASRVTRFSQDELTNHNYYKTILHRSNSIISYFIEMLAKIKVSNELLAKKLQEAKQTQKDMIINQQNAERDIKEYREVLPKDKSYLKETQKVKQKQREIKIDVASLEGEVQMKKLLIYNNEAKCLEYWDDFTVKFEESKQIGALDTLLILKKKEYLDKKLEKEKIIHKFISNPAEAEKILKQKDELIENLRSQVKYVCYCKSVLKRIFQKRLNRGIQNGIGGKFMPDLLKPHFDKK